MGKLLEKTVQEKARIELEKYYFKDNSIGKIFTKLEARTIPASGGKRADGLLCFLKDQKPYTISFEAKSHKTLGALIPFNNDEKFALHSLLGSSSATAGLVFSLLFYTDLKWYFISLIAVVSFAIFTLAIAIVLDLLDIDNHRLVRVIDQLKQYPANEQWVVYSKYADNLLLKSPSARKKGNLETLEALCRKNKFGLLLISPNKVEFRVTPKEKKGDFLRYYCKEKEIMKTLQLESETANAF